MHVTHSVFTIDGIDIPHVAEEMLPVCGKVFRVEFMGDGGAKIGIENVTIPTHIYERQTEGLPITLIRHYNFGATTGTITTQGLLRYIHCEKSHNPTEGSIHLTNAFFRIEEAL
ncbi:MAG TPA: hypothetical protein VGN87_06250 [Paenibacillus sp.]